MDVIEKVHGPAASQSLKNLNRDITSFSVLDDGRWFAVAYYLQGSASALEEPLIVDRYDRTRREWLHAELSSDQPDAGDTVCYGSAVEFRSLEDGFALVTHINPSAECTLLLSADLKVRKSLYGWILGTFRDGRVVYHRSQIHFAPVHAVEIALYNPKSGEDFNLYPRKPYQPMRLAESAKLAKFFKNNEAWCSQHNHSCDPEWFESSLSGEVAVNDDTNSLAFTLDFGSDKEDSNAPPVTTGHRKAVYVFRNPSAETGVEFREIPESQVTAKFGSVPPKSLLEPYRLKMVFGM